MATITRGLAPRLAHDSSRQSAPAPQQEGKNVNHAKSAQAPAKTVGAVPAVPRGALRSAQLLQAGRLSDHQLAAVAGTVGASGSINPSPSHSSHQQSLPAAMEAAAERHRPAPRTRMPGCREAAAAAYNTEDRRRTKTRHKIDQDSSVDARRRKREPHPSEAAPSVRKTSASSSPNSSLWFSSFPPSAASASRLVLSNSALSYFLSHLSACRAATFSYSAFSRFDPGLLIAVR